MCGLRALCAEVPGVAGAAEGAGWVAGVCADLRGLASGCGGASREFKRRGVYGPGFLGAGAGGGCVFGVVWLWPIANWTDFLLAAGVYGSVCALVLFFFYLRREEREMFIGPLRRFLPGR